MYGYFACMYVRSSVLELHLAVVYDIDWELNLNPVEEQFELFPPEPSTSSDYVNL